MNGNEEAFARAGFFASPDTYDLGAGGLTKREYFAAMAMQGMVADSNLWLSSETQPGSSEADVSAEQNLALAAVEQADALIAALNQEAK